jgi:hypothetical protein
VTDFPDPDSPTNPRTSPAASVKLRSQTAAEDGRPAPAARLEEGKRTVRFRTSSSGVKHVS